MPLDIQQIGTHAGSGLLATLLTYFGIKQRMDKQDEAIRAITEKAERTEDKVVYKDVHAECSRSWHSQLSEMNNKLDTIMKHILKPR